ncbi:MAG TPA: DUF1015 domain-containing protein [Desulfotomaculum sp.]|nr:DUF1015 domain-containing protein [Desulfotomaculum sp.]
MAVILPLQGLRYTAEAGSSPADLVTPPYDVIDLQAQDVYYQRSPYNIIRLEYGKTYPPDTAEHNRYTRAAAFFKEWQDKRILAPEKQAAIYLYKQEFKINSRRYIRTGFICKVKLEPYAKGEILPHEETLSWPKNDRLALIRACKANFSPIFGLYADPDLAVENYLHQATQSKNIKPPAMEFTDETGQDHRLWVVTGEKVIQQVGRAMKDKLIYIADGHHRYETALEYCLTQGNGKYIMMTLVNLYDPGLVILPTHRLIKSLGRLDINNLLELLAEYFIIEEFPLTPNYENLNQFSKTLTEHSDSAEGLANSTPVRKRHAFGLYCGNHKLYLLILKDKKNVSLLMPKDKSITWQNLDVAILHYLVLENLLKVKNLSTGECTGYTSNTREALMAVDRKEYQLAFLLNPTLVSEVITIAKNREKMPQKSTFFYPKLITGLVISKL